MPATKPDGHYWPQQMPISSRWLPLACPMETPGKTRTKIESISMEEDAFWWIIKAHPKIRTVMLRRDTCGLDNSKRFLTNGDLKAKLAAMVSAGSRQRKMAPNSMSFPMRTSTGRQARWYPSGVSLSSAVRAPRSCRRCLAASKLPVAGGSMSREKTDSSICSANTSRILILSERGGNQKYQH